VLQGLAPIAEDLKVDFFFFVMTGTSPDLKATDFNYPEGDN